MPNSSRRKQSKPQHLPSEEEEGATGNDLKQKVTSSCPPSGVKDTQEDDYGSKVTGKDEQENGDSNGGDLVIDHDTSEKDSPQDVTEMSEHSDNDRLPHDLSVRAKVTDNNLDIEDNLEFDDDDLGGDGPVPLYSPPSALISDRFCVYCNAVKASPADLERHLRKHTGDRPFHCDECSKQFKSKRSLQYHQYMNHGKEPSDGNIAQRYQLLQKRRNEESLSGSPVLSETDIQQNETEGGLVQHEPASKRQRFHDSLPPHLSLYKTTLYSGVGAEGQGFDLRLPKPGDVNSKGSSNDDIQDGQDLTKTCPVCTKAFPKPSDLKRHMMCHTGEKPFSCELCSKPFRSKSSMQYHLKAVHGLGIELSPGLEERFLRKSRGTTNYPQRSHLADGSVYRQENHSTIDGIDEYEEESIDSSSMFPNSMIGSDGTDTKSQGHNGNTGNDDDKLALDLSVSGRSKVSLGDVITGDNIIQTELPFKKSRISIHNETILVTRLDGLDLVNGQNSSIYKCYLCGKMFYSMSKLQCHLSLHFEKRIVTYECCFCEELFQFKTQLRNHIRRQHGSQFNTSKGSSNPENQTSKGLGTMPDDNRYSCRVCQKVFDKKISLNKHTRLHFWNRNSFCRICGKSFIHYTSLQLHMSRFHWKTIGKSSKISPLRRKTNFFNTYRFKPESHDGMPVNINNDEPLDLITHKNHNGSISGVIPCFPSENGEHSDAGMSHNSSENNWSGELNEDGVEIKSAPMRSLLPFKEHSPRHKPQRKSTPNHLKSKTSDNTVPLTDIKSESPHQDSNNNESVLNNAHSIPFEGIKGRALPIGGPREALLSGYNMNATNHLLMAKALAAHQTLSHLTNTSQPMIFPPNHLPPNLAAMTQMMTLPVTVAAPTSTEGVVTASQSPPSPASYTSSKSDNSPEDRDYTKDGGMRDSILGYPRGPYVPGKDNWTFNMYSPSGDTSHTDGRKVSSLSRTHSRLGIVHTPINREAVCKPTILTDGRTVYKCPFCSKEFVSFSDINRHMDFHEDIRPYKCQFCDYFARTNSQLKVHMMRHQGIREYCCKLCNYKGVTQSDLNRHMKSQIHMLKARNACTYCGEGFVTGKNLEKHLDGNCIVKMQKLNGGLDMPLQESIA